MFEITGDDVQNLNDSHLRTLVARLAIAELRERALPVSGVTAGGHQNAPDGGLDVRVEVRGDCDPGDFIPRVPLGIQVKKPDMTPAAISHEMKPDGVLRPVIRELADLGGAYVIVSSQGSVADAPLQKRRKAMRDALTGHPLAGKLHVDFYDRERLAAWVNQYPGVAAWTRARIGRSLAGWQALGDWSGIHVEGDGKYLSADTACLIDARTKDQSVLSIIEGIERIRRALSGPGQCIRLIGMSGLGKTRLVQALFESDVGTEALDPSFAIYTDYSETPHPTAKQLALQLVETNQRAILIIDNCNPQTHNDLAKICNRQKSRVSLLTVEYDVGDDMPEYTEVFRLQAASNGTIAAWVKVRFPHVSQVDRDRIAEFSGGNFRIAGVLAETIKQGESLGHLRNRDLFLRIFQQRNDHSENLLHAAEALALVYSFDGEDTSPSGELALLAPLAGSDVSKLYGAIAELKRRELIQSRGKMRAVLPQAIANRLAAQALERIPPDQFDTFCAALPLRMLKSLSRRLGYLHDKDEAQNVIARWLNSGGPLGDLLTPTDHSLTLLRNIAPVAPELVLKRIEEKIETTSGNTILDPKFPHRWQLTMILKSLAYDPVLFDRAAYALAIFVAAEAPDENHNSAKGPFEELFYVVLSGTHALPDQRRQFIRTLCKGNDQALVRCGLIGLRSLLESGHFSATSNFEFGARPRDFGWHPLTYEDRRNWYREAISLAMELSQAGQHRCKIKKILSCKLRGILAISSCLEAVESAVAEFMQDGEWLDGWFAIRAAIRFDGKDWPKDIKERVQALERILRPSDPLNEARAYVLEGHGVGFTLLDGDIEEDKDYSAALNRVTQRAQAIGREFGVQPDLLNEFLFEALQSKQSPQAFSFGIGLAEADISPTDMWQKLRTALVRIPVELRNDMILGGFLCRVHQSDLPVATMILNDALVDEELAPHFVYLQARAGINGQGIERLRQAITRGIDVRHFNALACGVIKSAPQTGIASMLKDLSTIEGGNAVALDILHMAIFCLRSDGEDIGHELLHVGHYLLLRATYKDTSSIAEHCIQEMIKYCYAGPDGVQAARELCQEIRNKIADLNIRAWQLDYVFDALFEVQPIVALDEILLANKDAVGDPIYGSDSMARKSPLENVGPAELCAWADIDPNIRYPLIGRSLSVFQTQKNGDDIGLSPLFLEALERSPDRGLFLQHNAGQLSPSSWSGNLSAILDKRREMLAGLSSHNDVSVQSWVRNQSTNLKKWADAERQREARREESFE